MTGLDRDTSKSPDRTGVCCTGRCAPSQCETITGPSFSSLNKPDQERTPAYRDSSGSESPSGCLLCYFFRRLGGAIWGIPGENLLNQIGKALKPAVLCNGQLRNQGAGHPDFGFYSKNQRSKGEPKEGQASMPERGVVEVKGLADETWLTAETEQVSTYWQTYRQVLVTNYRDFLLIGEDAHGHSTKLEAFRLANSEAEFWSRLQTPRKYAQEIGPALTEYLNRVLTQSVSLKEPRDVAWFLASYARDALGRVEDKGDVPALAAVRTALEEALGVNFKGDNPDSPDGLPV